MSSISVPESTPGRARALSDRIVQAIDEYRAQNPHASDRDVAEALRLVRSRVGRHGANVSLTIVVLVGLAAVVGLLLLLFATGIQPVPVGHLPLAPLVAAVVVAVAAIAAVLMMRSS